MSWTPISGSALQYMQDSVAANNYYIKFYASGTTTPISMATDSTGGTLLAKAQFNAQGYAINGSSAVFIPHIDQKYRILFYPNATDADANTFANAIYDIDLVDTFVTTLPVETNKNAATVAALTADTTATVNDLYSVEDYASGNDSGVLHFKWVTGSAPSADGGYQIAHDTLNLYAQQLLASKPSVKFWGVAGDGTDEDTQITAALAFVASVQGTLYFPANRSGSTPTVYSHSTTLEFGASDVTIEGENPSVQLTYTGTGTGLSCKATADGSAIERWGLRNISLVSSTGAIGFDYTSGNYGNYENVEINYTAANAQHLYATGNTGVGPYFNKFDGMTFFGSAGRTQEAIVMKSDASGNLADGPNANSFTNIKRGASLSRLINLVAGTGNMFANIGGESISDALIVLNEIPSFVDSGTSTGTTQNTLTDTSKTWSGTPGNALNFTNDTVELTSGIIGESRRIVSNDGTTLTLDKPWSQYPGAAVSYRISEGKAVKNMFMNIRQEGLASDNPDCIRAMPGSRGNEFSQLEAGSLGTGKIFSDLGQDQTNVVRQGDLMIFQYQALNPGASATVEITPPRSSAEGGIRVGSLMTLEYVEMTCPNFVTGSATATLTVDHGGASTGAGIESLTAIIDDVTSAACYKSGDTKVQRSTSNNGIFASLTTNGNVNAASDFTINIAVRVQ